MSDFIQSMQEVYKKWEPKSAANFTRSRRGTNNRFSSARNWESTPDHFQIVKRDKHKYSSRLPRSNQPKYDSLAPFKMAPCIVAENKPRPFVGSACSKCLPLSRANLQDSSVFCMGICNVLHLPYFKGYCFPLTFSYSVNIWKRSPAFPDVSEKVLKNERIETCIQDLENSELGDGEQPCTLAEVNNTAKNILSKVKSSMSVVCLWFTASVLHHILKKILDGVLIHKGHIDILKSSIQDDIPFVYIPLHRSRLDAALISFVLHMNSLKVPLVAVYDDLYFPFFGSLMKFLGAFFIRRRLHETTKKEYLYRAVLSCYMTECLKAGYNLEIFIEGSRSRSGKPQLPSTGLLSAVLKSVSDGSLEDVYIVPVSISYEKIIEESFWAEQLGHCKEKESFCSVFLSIWRIMHMNYGNVRLNFCQPFSLSEFIQSNQRNSKLPPSSDTPPESPSRFSPNAPDLIRHEVHHHWVLNNLARHIVYDASFSTAVMSTHLVAFLFISQYRKGATQQQLQNSLDWLRGELLAKKRDVGFTGESLPVIKRAIDLLGKDLISSETIDMEWTSSDLENNNVKVVVYTPVVQLPHVLELQYYANSVIPIFLLDSIMVNAIYALVDVEICHFRHCDSQLYVCREKLVEKAIKLNNILQFEFIAVPPCADISLSFNDVLDRLIEKECLHIAGMSAFTGSSMRHASKKSHALSFESSDEDDEGYSKPEQQLKIDLSEESIKHLESLRNILSPCIESYWLSACTLLKLIDEVKEEKLFIEEMQLTAQEKLSKGLLAYEESFSAEILKNALRLFEHWHVIESYTQDNLKILYLADTHNCCERVNELIERIEEFRK